MMVLIVGAHVWFLFGLFPHGIYRKKYLSILEGLYIINSFVLVSSVLAADQETHLVSDNLTISVALFGFVVTVMIKLFYRLKKLHVIERITSFLRNRPPSLSLEEQNTANEVEVTPDYHCGSPPSIVYQSLRGENQFELTFNHSNSKSESFPVLMEREPLLFD